MHLVRAAAAQRATGRDVELRAAKFLSLLLLLVIIIIVIKILYRVFIISFLVAFSDRHKNISNRRAACCQLLNKTRTHALLNSICAIRKRNIFCFSKCAADICASAFSGPRDSNYLYVRAVCDNYPRGGKLSVMREMRGSDFSASVFFFWYSSWVSVI